MIVLEKSQYESIVKYAKENLPNEACGLLAGIKESISENLSEKISDNFGSVPEGNKAVVKKVYLLTNADKSPEHFSMLQNEQFDAIKDIRKKGLILIGNFHSHPYSPSRPSDEDIRLAFDPDLSYLILSLEKANEILKSFKIVNKKVTEEKLVII